MSATNVKRGFWPAYVLGGLTVLCAALLWQVFGQPPAAYGQVPDSGAQRLEMIAELRASNQKLGEIAGLLREIRDLEAGKKDKEKDARPPRP
jgi:type II secretory pathway component PulM